MTCTENPHVQRCPLAAVDQRLQDLHRQWHEAEQAYFDPDGFRIAIQTAIQTSRTVSFILQSNKAIITNFEPWYRDWQDQLRADPLMRWMVDARNKIEKRGDLEAKSFVRAEIVASYLNEGPVVEVEAHLFQSVDAMIASIPPSVLKDHVSKHGLLRIQRKWVENSLPDYELLDAVAIAYGKISELVHDAHRQAGLPTPVLKDGEREYAPGRGGRMPCMIGHDEFRTMTLSLAEGTQLTLTAKPISIDMTKAEGVSKRYDISPQHIFSGTGDVEKELQSLFRAARVMTEKDRHHITIMFLFRQGKLVNLMQFTPKNQAEKYLLLRQAANDVAKFSADAAIMIGEVWRAKADPAKPYMQAAEAPDRDELLNAVLVRKDGEPIQLSALMTRKQDKVSLGDTVEERDGAYFMFAPMYEVWGRPIPEEWVSRMKKAQS